MRIRLARAIELLGGRGCDAGSGGIGEMAKALAELLEQDSGHALAQAQALAGGKIDLIERSRVLALADQAEDVWVLREDFEGRLGEAHDRVLRGELLQLFIARGGEEAGPAMDSSIFNRSGG